MVHAVMLAQHGGGTAPILGPGAHLEGRRVQVGPLRRSDPVRTHGKPHDEHGHFPPKGEAP